MRLEKHWIRILGYLDILSFFFFSAFEKTLLRFRALSTLFLFSLVQASPIDF